MTSITTYVVCCILFTNSGVCGVEYLVGFIGLISRKKKNIMQSHLMVSSYKPAKVNFTLPYYSTPQQVKIKPKKYFKWVADPLEERATKSDCTEKIGLLIQSNRDVCVHGVSFDYLSFGGFHAYPLTEDSTEFYVATYDTKVTKGITPFASAEILILSNSSNNRVTITQKREEGYEEKKVIRIDEFDAYQFRRKLTDYTGTHISSAKPITVFSGVDCGQVPITTGWCDNMVSGIPPVSKLGTRYIVAPLANRAKTTGYIVRVVSTRDNNYITSNERNKTLDQGEFWEIEPNVSSTQTMDIRCRFRCMVVQFGKGKTADYTQWDPFMMVLIPVSSYTNKAIWTNPVDRHGLTLISFANIVVPTGQEDGVRLDDKNITANWTLIPDSGFSYVTVKKFHGPHNVIHIDENVKVNVMNYGRGTSESMAYGFPACAIPPSKEKDKEEKDSPKTGASCMLMSKSKLHPLWFILAVLGGLVLGVILVMLYVWSRVRGLKGVSDYVFCPCNVTGEYKVKS